MEIITNIVIAALAVGSFTAWCITLAQKRGWIEKWQAKSPSDLLWELLSCNYCMSFWLGLAVSVLLSYVTGEWCLLLVPFVSTKISTLLLK